LGTNVKSRLSETVVRKRLLNLLTALAQATDEQQITAAISIMLDTSARLRLLYLDMSETGVPYQIRVVASRQDGFNWPGDPLLNTGFPVEQCPLFLMLGQQRDPIWFEPNVGDFGRDPVVQATRRAIAIKLYGAANIEQQPQWHSILLITWSEPRRFTRAERYVCSAVWDTLSVVVSNRRLRIDALEYVQRLRELDRMKSEFLGSVNHELRTPLNGILALSSSLLDGRTDQLNPRLRADLEMIYRAGEQLHTLILDILNYTQLESGKPFDLDVRSFSLHDLVEEAVEFMRRLNSGKPITIRASVSSSLPLVLADPQRVRQVLVNLLTNAVKFTEKGTIQVSAQADQGKLLVCVEDSGTGIPPEYQAIIFEPFRQLRSPQCPKGTGLGLSICKRLLALMDSSIWVESQLGTGSRFYFSLPTS